MPDLDWDPSNKSEAGIDYPKLKLKNGEYARILVIDKMPKFHWAHTLRAPKIVNGEAVKTSITRKDGSTFSDYVKEYIGQPQCLGDLGVMKDKGVDTRNCPLCERAKETGEIEQAKRRMAMHVIRYGTRPGGWDVRTPFSVELVVWGFTDQIYNKLNNISNQYGNLRERDLLLGPCTDEGFQKFEIMVGPDAAWQKDTSLKAMVLEAYRPENRYPGDLENFCGRKVERAWMLNDIERVAERWRIAHQKTNFSAPARADGTEQAIVNHALAAGLDGLTPTQQQAPAATGQQQNWLADSADADALVAQQQAEAARRAAPPTTAPAIDFDDLLGGGRTPAELSQTRPTSAPPAAPVSAQPAVQPAAAGADAFDDLLNAVG